MVKSIQGNKHQLPIFHLHPNGTQLRDPIHVARHIICLAHGDGRGLVLQEKLSINKRTNKSKPETSPCWASCVPCELRRDPSQNQEWLSLPWSPPCYGHPTNPHRQVLQSLSRRVPKSRLPLWASMDEASKG